MRAFHRFKRDTQGAILVEFAFTIGAFLLLVIGALELCMVMFIGASVEKATYRAGEAYSKNLSIEELEAKLESELYPLAAENTTYSIENYASNFDYVNGTLATEGQAPVITKISVVCNWPTMTQFFANTVIGQFEMTSTSVVRISDAQ